ncbi:class I SAM-dependent DNA methyltransferase [Actinoplanes sp. NPDC023801]|uniref:type I restriction-modification system subunit M n=1 Tax=Actinoplanes sp. NPDC023801 TaxID=3154595 RepID=UPI0033E04DAD
MIGGELRNRIDRVWDAFWSGGISNPLEVTEQITYLMFLRLLDELHARRERDAASGGELIKDPVFTAETERLRWCRFTAEKPADMLAIVGDEVFPWLRTLGRDGSAFAHHMRDARFTVPTAALLARAVRMIDDLALDGRDTKGDLYEYMLSRIATAGQNGQFRTPRHIIEVIVEMMAPGPDDEICDPACGTAGFLVASAAYVSRTHREALLDPGRRRHFGTAMFHGFDFDRTMLRIASMNMLLHEVEQPDIRYRDSLAESAAEDAGRYSMVLANPPFAGSLDDETIAADLRRTVRTRKTELLFLALVLRLLRPGGRAAVIVPEGVLFGSTRAHRDLRRTLVEEQQLEAVVKLPGGVFKPYAGVSTAVLIFRRTDAGGTGDVWFYEVTADGYTLDDRRAPLPAGASDLPDLLARWAHRDGRERERARTDRSFRVPREEIAAQGYDLSLNRYRRVVHEELEFRSSTAILDDLERIESEIQQGLSELKGLLG